MKSQKPTYTKLDNVMKKIRNVLKIQYHRFVKICWMTQIATYAQQ